MQITRFLRLSRSLASSTSSSMKSGSSPSPSSSSSDSSDSSDSFLSPSSSSCSSPFASTPPVASSVSSATPISTIPMICAGGTCCLVLAAPWSVSASASASFRTKRVDGDPIGFGGSSPSGLWTSAVTCTDSGAPPVVCGPAPESVGLGASCGPV